MDCSEYRDCLAECFEEAALEIPGQPGEYGGEYDLAVVRDLLMRSAHRLRGAIKEPGGTGPDESLYQLLDAHEYLENQGLTPAIIEDLMNRLQAITAGFVRDPQGHAPEPDGLGISEMARLVRHGEARQQGRVLRLDLPSPALAEAAEEEAEVASPVA